MLRKFLDGGTQWGRVLLTTSALALEVSNGGFDG